MVLRPLFLLIEERVSCRRCSSIPSYRDLHAHRWRDSHIPRERRRRATSCHRSKVYRRKLINIFCHCHIRFVDERWPRGTVDAHTVERESHGSTHIFGCSLPRWNEFKDTSQAPQANIDGMTFRYRNRKSDGKCYRSIGSNQKRKEGLVSAFGI